MMMLGKGARKVGFIPGLASRTCFDIDISERAFAMPWVESIPRIAYKQADSELLRMLVPHIARWTATKSI